MPGAAFADLPLSGSVRGRTRQLSLLPMLVDAIDNASGEADLDFTVAGRVGAPRARGRSARRRRLARLLPDEPAPARARRDAAPAGHVPHARSRGQGRRRDARDRRPPRLARPPAERRARAHGRPAADRERAGSARPRLARPPVQARRPPHRSHGRGHDPRGAHPAGGHRRGRARVLRRAHRASGSGRRRRRTVRGHERRDASRSATRCR